MKRNPILEQIRKNRPKYVDVFVDLAFDLAERLQSIMDEQGLDQKGLAKLLNKHESEISKWLSGNHNFTFKTLAKIQVALDATLVKVCNEYSEDYKTEVIFYTDSLYLFDPKNNQNKDCSIVSSFRNTLKLNQQHQQWQKTIN